MAKSDIVRWIKSQLLQQMQRDTGGRPLLVNPSSPVASEI
jgi:hypothetical protein